MKNILLLLLCLLFSFSLSAQLTTESKAPSTFAVAINQDNAFGFYPSIFGSFGLDDQLSFTYYGNLWTNPTYGNIDAGGIDNWLEVGVGLSFLTLNDQFLVNPFLGFTHGKLLSGGESGVVGDGIVPGIAGFFLSDKWDIELFGSYYKALRNEGPVTFDYFLYWVLPGYIVNEHVTLGIHHESFILTRETGAEAFPLYQWLGGFAKFTVDNKYVFRFSAGKNFKTDFNSKNFYKLTVFIPLL